MSHNSLKISNKNGQQLNASLELPANAKPSYFVIFAHCFSCTSDFKSVRNISRALNNEGFGVIRFDFTGLGKSEGEFADSHFSANVSDLLAVNAYVTKNYKAPSLLVGHSLGGAAVIVAASKLENIKAVATIGAPAHVDHVTHHFSHAIEEVKEKGEVEVSIGGRPFKINQEFVDDFSKTDLLKVTKNLRKPILILHSPTDKIVSVENAQELYKSAMHPKSFISLDDADHLLTSNKDSLYVGKMIGNWAQRYLPSEKNQVLYTAGEQLVAHLNVLEDHFTTTVQTETHSFLADEPASANGYDLGPSPYDLLSAALATCTAMTLKLYAERKKWDLQEIFVYITYSRRHAEDLMEEGKSQSKIDHLQKRLKFIGNLDATQKKRLKEIASKCPVHKTLITTTVIDTELI